MVARVTIIFFPSMLLLLFLFGLLYFVEKIKTKPDVSLYDGVAVLTGGEGRIEIGLNSIKTNLKAKLLISGVGEGVSLSSLSINSSYYEERIDFGRKAKTTLQNAFEISNWAKKNHYNKVRIITAAYHMPRSIVLLKRVNSDLEILPYPVFSNRVKLDEWWLWTGTLSLLCEEYLKYIISYIQPIFIKDKF